MPEDKNSLKQNQEDSNLKIDHLDEKIIEILSRDGRASNMEIAREIHLAEATVRRRVKRLIDSELIKIVAIPSPKQFSKFTTSVLGVSCNGAYIEEIATYLTNLSETSYVGFSTGKWDLVVEAFFMSREHMLNFLIDLNKKEGVKDIESSLILSVRKFSYECDIINYRQTL
jgi:Lrp/AsnC family transcriptional regulator for asnA, asnC and gidA